MIKAIVYTSNTGSTKKYAEMLGAEIGIPVYDIKKSRDKLETNDNIIYMGWIMAGVIKKYKKISKQYNVVVVCSVGMSQHSDTQYNQIMSANNITSKLFYLRGGCNKKNLKGIYKLMINSLEKMIKKKLELKEDKTEEELEILDMLTNGKDYVTKENLNEIIDWVNTNYD